MTIIKDRQVNQTFTRLIFGGLYWPNGEEATGSLPGNNSVGWAGFPDGTKLKVTRAGDIITIETSDIYSPDTYLPGAATVIDLNSSPELAVFKGPQQWGYIALSQAAATWEVLQRPVDRDEVFDTSTNTLWKWENNNWVENTNSNIGDVLKPGRLYFNQVLNKLDYYDPDTLTVININ